MQDVNASVNIATFTRQRAGRLATTSNQNGTSTDYTWDGFGRIQEIDHLLWTVQTFLLGRNGKGVLKSAARTERADCRGVWSR